MPVYWYAVDDVGFAYLRLVGIADEADQDTGETTDGSESSASAGGSDDSNHSEGLIGGAVGDDIRDARPI